MENELIGDFRVVRSRSREGRARVLEATQISLDQPVELELLDPGAPDDMVDTALREAAAASKCPDMLEIIGTGISDRGAYRAVRAPQAPSLREALDAGLDSSRAIAIARGIGRALDALHAAGLVHRDLRPETVFVAAGDRVRLAPPALPPSTGRTSTITASEPPSFAYLAPEVLGGDAPEAASDRYGLAAIVFEALTGRPPFADPDRLLALEGGRAPTASSVRTDLPAGVDAPLAAGLAADVERRPASAASLVADVERGLGTVVVPSAGIPGELERTPARWFRLAWIAAGAATAAAVVLAIGLVGGKGEDSDTPSVLAGATPIGSDLSGPAAEIKTLDCDGDSVSKRSRACSIRQTSLLDALLVAPEDGAIKGWAVRGASGKLQLQVLRPREGGYFQVFVSQTEFLPDAGVHYFPANTEIWQGDVVAVQVYRHSAIGVRPGVAGAAAERWIPPQYGQPPRAADFQAHSGFDYELEVRADYIPGGSIDLPEQLDGADAATAPSGKVLESNRVVLSKDLTSTVSLVRLEDAIAIDMTVDGRRSSRMIVPDVDLAGEPVYFDAAAYDTNYGGVSLEWRNPDRRVPIEHYAEIKGRTFDFIS